MKRTFNDFRRITRSMRLERRERLSLAQSSQTAAAVRLSSSQPPLKRLKTKLLPLSLTPLPVGYCGFDWLPNEIIEKILEDVPWILRVVLATVCKRWKDGIERHFVCTNTVSLFDWIIANNSRTLLEWFMARTIIKWRHFFSTMVNICIRHANLSFMTYFFKAAGEGESLLTAHSMRDACKHGDLDFLRGVLKLFKKDPQAVVDRKCLEAACAGGQLETAQWIVEK